MQQNFSTSLTMGKSAVKLEQSKFTPCEKQLLYKNKQALIQASVTIK